MIADHLTQSNSSLGESVEQRVKLQKIEQVDFYRNPTILSRLVLNEKYASALKRLNNHPEEASTWVCSKRNPFKGKDVQSYFKRSQSRRRSLSSASSIRRLNSKLDPQLLDYSIRQLPIHVACSSLFRASAAQRADLELLITHLAVMYPDGCQQPDHEGKLPLHEAVWHNASPETISVLLMASPSTLHERDKFGRAPLELNRFRSGEDKEQIKDMLLRGVAYWESARTEALLRTKEGTAGDEQGNILRGISMRLEKGAGDSGYDLVEPVTWRKLETRAKYLEQLLSSMYEKNYELGELVDSLSSEKMHLRDELDRLENSSTSKESSQQSASDMREEIDYLYKEISLLQEQLKEKEQSTSGETQFDLDAVRYLEWRNSTMQDELNEMTERNRENELKLDRLEIVVASLRKKLKAGESKRDNQGQSASIAAKHAHSAWEDFMELLETSSSQSPLALERFLSGKIMNLEEQLADLIRTAELDHAASKEENKRLIRENEALQREVTSLSDRQLPPQGKDTARNSLAVAGSGDAPSKKGRSGRRGPTPQSNPHKTDNLDEILRQAAWMYGSDFHEFEESNRCPENISLDHGKSLDDIFPSDVFHNEETSKTTPTENVVTSRAASLAPTDPLSNIDTAWNAKLIKQLDTIKRESITERQLELLATSTATVPFPNASLAAAPDPPWNSQLSEHRKATKRESITVLDASSTGAVPNDKQLSSDVVESQLSYFRDSDPKFSESLTLSDLWNSRSWRLPRASNHGLQKIPTEVIVALRTASFSIAHGDNIEKILEEADMVSSTPIPDNVKALIRERYRKEGGCLSKLLLAWLSENLGESEDQGSSLSADDLNTVFAGADQLGSGHTPSSDTELAPTPSLTPTSTESGRDNARATGFREMARAVSVRQRSSRPTLAEPFASGPRLATAHVSEIFNEAAKDYSRPILGMEPDAPSSQRIEFSSDTAFDTRARTRNAATTERDNGRSIRRL
jgi:regulator of replication initiation timing